MRIFAVFLSCKQHVMHVGHGLVTKIDFFFSQEKATLFTRLILLIQHTQVR